MPCTLYPQHVPYTLNPIPSTLYPKKADSPRIINVASNAGRLAILKSEALRAKFSNPAVQVSSGQ